MGVAQAAAGLTKAVRSLLLVLSDAFTDFHHGPGPREERCTRGFLLIIAKLPSGAWYSSHNRTSVIITTTDQYSFPDDPKSSGGSKKAIRCGAATTLCGTGLPSLCPH